MKYILVTGGLGFIGSNFIEYLLEHDDNIFVVNIDNMTYAANDDSCNSFFNTNRYEFIKCDICDTERIKHILAKYNISHVFHFAAETHVDNSIKKPEIFAETNIMGTISLLKACYEIWMDGPGVFKYGCENTKFHHISTDEVFGSLGKYGFFNEESRYAPNSPYSASKASSDMMVRSFICTYGLNAVITNCSNNYGPYQNKEKLIPTIIRKAISGEEIPIYGNGENIRDWLYVKDHCEAIFLIFKKCKNADTYLIGGENELTNIQVANIICDLLDDIAPKKYRHRELITFVNDRPGHDYRYAVDISKIANSIGWRPKESFETAILKTIQWYMSNKTYLK